MTPKLQTPGCHYLSKVAHESDYRTGQGLQRPVGRPGIWFCRQICRLAHAGIARGNLDVADHQRMACDP